LCQPAGERIRVRARHSAPIPKNWEGTPMSKRLLVAVSLLLFLPELVMLQTSSASAELPTLNDEGVAAIDRMLQAAIDKEGIPGAVVAVADREQVLYLKAFGK